MLPISNKVYKLQVAQTLWVIFNKLINIERKFD